MFVLFHFLDAAEHDTLRFQLFGIARGNVVKLCNGAFQRFLGVYADTAVRSRHKVALFAELRTKLRRNSYSVFSVQLMADRSAEKVHFLHSRTYL